MAGNYSSTVIIITTNMLIDLSIFTLPFMQRALIGGIIIAALLAYYGIFAMLRRSSFFGDAIAHSSLTGVALGVLLGVPTLIAAIVYAMAVSFFIPILKKKSNLPTDSLLGIILPFSMALGVILLSVIPGYQPELISFLFGNILGISWNNIYLMAAVTAILIVCIFFFQKKLLNISFDSDYATILGIKVNLIDTLYHVSLAVSIVLGIQLVGIVLVNALLIIPAATARIFARSLKSMFVLAPIFSVSAAVVGLFASYYLNFPSGPMIAVTSGLVFLLAILWKNL